MFSSEIAGLTFLIALKTRFLHKTIMHANIYSFMLHYHTVKNPNKYLIRAKSFFLTTAQRGVGGSSKPPCGGGSRTAALKGRY